MGSLQVIKLPRHLGLHITHNQHKIYYMSIQDYVTDGRDRWDVDQADLDEILSTGEIWEIQWYPNTPIGFRAVAAATLERALELANAD
jgi:hypothetical protein